MTDASDVQLVAARGGHACLRCFDGHPSPRRAGAAYRWRGASGGAARVA